jgi:hypothetical protein
MLMQSQTNISVTRWQPGVLVPHSGVYLMHHGDEHSKAEEIILLAGKNFPQCEVCREAASFELVRTAPYVFHDDDFRNVDGHKRRR